MRNIYLTAGHGGSDPGAIGNGFKEADLTRELRDMIELYLIGNMGVSQSKIKTDSDADRLPEVLKKIQGDEYDIIIDIHFNAASATATGTEVIIPERHTTLEYNLAKDLVSVASSTIGIPSRGVKTEKQTARGRIGILQETGINSLIETCFISNSSDIRKYQAAKENFAKQVAAVIYSYHIKL